MNRILPCCLLVMLFVTGCWGTNTIYIRSYPPNCHLYVNGEYVGKTPMGVPQEWQQFLFWSQGEDLLIRLEKENYLPREKLIDYEEQIQGWYSQGGFSAWESEHGWGSKFHYYLALESVPASQQKVEKSPPFAEAWRRYEKQKAQQKGSQEIEKAMEKAKD